MAKTAQGFEAWDFTKFWDGFALPEIDVEAFASAQRRNVEALATANRVAVEGFQAVARRQAEIVRAALETSAKAAKTYSEAATPAERIARQAELSKDAFETGMTNFRELSAMATDTADKAIRVVADRFAEGIGEMSDIVAETTKSPAKPAPSGAKKQD